jgi:hypothetical protein
MNPEDDLLDPAPRDLFYAWAIGVIAALALAIYGSLCIYERSATMWGLGSDFDLGSGPSVHCHGASAIGIGVTWVAIAGFLHFHFFWSWRQKFHAFAQVGKLLSLVGIAGGMLCFIMRFWLD